MGRLLTAEFAGVVAQYGDTMLFIGFDLGDGQFQITVYPSYRLSGDDRVHGHIGIFDVPLGTPWTAIMEQVDAIEEEAQRNYQLCAQFRRQDDGGPYRRASSDRGVEQVSSAFRESWAGFALKLAREHDVTRGGVRFRGDPARAFLAEWRDRTYTVRVYDSGSMLVIPGDHTASIP